MTIVFVLVIGLLLGFGIAIGFIILHNTLIIAAHCLDIHEELQGVARRVDLVETRVLEAQKTRFNDICDTLSKNTDCVLDAMDGIAGDCCDWLIATNGCLPDDIVDYMKKNKKSNGENSQGV